MNEVYKVGDRIRIKKYDDIPEEFRNKGIARLCDKVGTIEDKLYSENSDGYVYKIKLDDHRGTSRILYTEDIFKPYSENKPEYDYEIEILDNVVVVRLYEEFGSIKEEVARGHGHIIHEGALGIAQATSYATKNILEKLNGGTIVTNTQRTWNPLRGGRQYAQD